MWIACPGINTHVLGVSRIGFGIEIESCHLSILLSLITFHTIGALGSKSMDHVNGYSTVIPGAIKIPAIWQSSAALVSLDKVEKKEKEN